VTPPARFLLTFDVELLWGVFFEAAWRRRARREFGEVREVFPEILEILRRHDVRATFAFVGHLFLDACAADDAGRLHPDMPRADHAFFEGDWYRFDPGTELRTDPLWYGRDLVEMVRAARPGHEIGCHGFSHALLDTDRELARAEMAAAAAAAKELGITPVSFVYPRNVVGYVDELRGAGFTHFRDAGDGSRALVLVRRLLGAAPSVGRPRERDGVVEVPAGIPILPCFGLRRLVPLGRRMAEVRKGLARAAETGGCFHLWTHPHNFVAGRERMLRGLDGALSLVAAARERGEIEVVTMGEVRP
jgi:peptidoglycan/xylan/chitin deacetylase (PgdA/CDA1 family)